MRRPFALVTAAATVALAFPTPAAAPSAPVGTAGIRSPRRVPAPHPHRVPPVSPETQHDSVPVPITPVDDTVAGASSTGVMTHTVWDRLAACESGGDWHINTGNGYFGGLQFSLRSWRWVGGTGYPHQATKTEQIHRAEHLLELQGWGAWPACSRKLGLR